MKRILLLSGLLFLTTAVFSQFTIGPKIGLNLSTLKTTFPEIKEEMKAGYQLGAFARFGKKIYVQPEVMFSTRGGIIKSETGINTKTTVDLKTMQVPLMIGYKLINLKVVNLRIMTGPAMSLVLNKEITVSSGNIEETIEDNNIKDAIWSWQLGAGVDVLMFTLDVRYEWGLNNMYDPEGGTSYDMKNNLWNISLGWKIL